MANGVLAIGADSAGLTFRPEGKTAADFADEQAIRQVTPGFLLVSASVESLHWLDELVPLSSSCRKTAKTIG